MITSGGLPDEGFGFVAPGERGIGGRRKCGMNAKDLAKIGIPAGPCAEAARQILQDAHAAKRSMAAVLDDLGRIAASPTTFLDDAIRGKRAGKEQESDYSSGPASSARWPRIAGDICAWSVLDEGSRAVEGFRTIAARISRPGRMRSAHKPATMRSERRRLGERFLSAVESDTTG